MLDVMHTLGGEDVALAAKYVAEKIGQIMDINGPRKLDEKMKELGGQAQKTNDFTEQNQYLVERAGKGFAIQPCWVASGMTQNLFDIILESDVVKLSVPSKLPDFRIEQKNSLPGLVLATRSFIPCRKLQ
jgi:hypothetical protein